MHNLPDSHPLTTREPGEIIAYDASGEVAVELFLARATELARRLPDHRYIINLAADRYTFLLGFCAAVIAGQCTLMPPNRQQQTLRQLADDFADCYSFGETGIAGVAQFEGGLDALGEGALDVNVPGIALDQLCTIVFTSGSTGVPTANRKYWRTLQGGTLSNVDLLLRDSVEPLNVLATVPPQHMWGFETSILLPLFGNVAVSYLTPFFPQDIADALENLQRPRALVSSPVHLSAFLSAGTAAVTVDRILSATAPMSQQLATELEKRYDARVIEVFGSSESGIIARRDTVTETLWQLSPAFRLELQKDGLRISAPHLPETVHLQDMVELVDDGHFRWLGRHQDMVNIAGKRGSLTDLNYRLNAIPGVTDGVIFMPDEDSKRLAALVVAPDLQPSDILKKLRPGIEPAFLPRPLCIVASLPRQETGKLSRKMVVELFNEIRRSKTQDNDDLADSAS